LAVIQKVIKDTPGVIIDFWSPTCPPCMRFKPTFEGMARNNTNKNIIFATCQTNEAREVAQNYNVQSIPQFNFFLGGSQTAMFVGADEKKFGAELAKLQKATGSKSNDHMNMTFSAFKPMNLAPISFLATNSVGKMKEFIINLASKP
jgi:thioredoxin-like negative regulator of GroEL